MGKILVIGDIMLDKYSYGEVKRLNPEGPNPLLNIEMEEFRLGGSANVASNIASLSGECDLVGVVGNDENRNIIEKLSKEQNINFYGITGDKPTTTKQRFIENGYKHQLLRVDYESKTELNSDNINFILNIAKNNSYEYIIVSDYNKGVINGELIDKLKRLNLKILVDTKPNNINLFEGVFLIKPNFREFVEMIGVSISNEDPQIEKYGLEFAKKMSTNLVITRGNKGASLITKNGKYYHIETQAKDIFDVTGAGDTFISALAFGLISGLDLFDSVKLGNKASGIVVGKVGTALITKKELGI